MTAPAARSSKLRRVGFHEVLLNRSPSASAARSTLAIICAILLSSCAPAQNVSQSSDSPEAPAAISLTIQNGKPPAALNLIAGHEYVFDRITLVAENRNVVDSRAAFNWLKNESSFRVLDWDGVREGRAHWRNYRESRADADLFSHVFEGAKWMGEPNAIELAILDQNGAVVGNPVRLSNQDFLNRLKQQDFDLVKAEYRYENFVRHKDLNSAKVKRAVAKVVFAVQTDLTKRLFIPANAHALRVVWDKNPQEPYVIPIHLIAAAYNYGGRLRVTIEPDKPVYRPGETIRATFTFFDQKGTPLKFSEADKNGIRQINIHLDGPVQQPTYYHEEWLSEFGARYAYHVRAPALGFGTETESATTPLKAPPLDPSGTNMIVELHVPKNLPKEYYGTFEIGATVWRNYASQALTARLEKPVQVGQREQTHFESFGCPSCHVLNTPTDLGLLVPPMVGTEKLSVESIQSCVMCHDNSRNGSRRLDKYLHLIHVNRDKFPAAKNNCAVCHLTAQSIRKVNAEVCSNCHEHLHQNNQPKYADAQCQSCHQDYARGHIAPVARITNVDR